MIVLKGLLFLLASLIVAIVCALLLYTLAILVVASIKRFIREVRDNDRND